MAQLTQDLAIAPVDDGGRTLADLMRIVARHRGVLSLVTVAVVAAAAVIASALPSVYRSSATILIKEQEIPPELVRSTVTTFADERIQVISQQVMTRATLLDLVDRHGLYGKARQRETSEEILERMRRDIKLAPISAEVTDRRTGSPTKATIAFTLSYESEVAANAQKIANELATLFLNENVKNRQQKAAETTSFLEEELARVTTHISEVEARLAEFKQRNQGRTPDLNLANIVGSERAEGDLQRVDREIAFLADRRQQLESQLAETRPMLPLAGANGAALDPEQRQRALQTQLATLTATYSEDHPDVRRVRRELAALKADGASGEAAADRETQLTRLRAELADLRKRYGEDHPDVTRLRRTYTALEATVHAAAPEPRREPTPDNPAYVALKAQIATTGSQIDSLRAERVELRRRLDQLTARLSQTPEIEREFLELARDLDSSRARFRELRDKQAQAQVAEQLERSRKAERFTIIEPPVFPERPSRPNRQLILLMGIALAVVAGFGAVALAHGLDRSVHDARDVQRLMPVPVLAVLPAPAPMAERTRRRRALLIVGVAALIVLGSGAAAVHWLYLPLDVAWFSLLRRVGA